MEEENKERSKLLFEKVVEGLVADKQTRAFAESFKKTYGTRVDQWAMSHRIGAGVNTNMHLEAFFNVLKTTYLDRRVNRRVDRLVATLLRVAKDKVFQRITKLKKGKCTFQNK